MFRRCTRWPRRGYAYAYSYEWQQPDHSRDPQKPTKMEMRGSRHGRHFGVKRPLRYLSYQLELEEDQVRAVASALDRLKNEREQARLDDARTATELAEHIRRGDTSMTSLSEALSPRTAASERLQQAIARAVHDITKVLEDEQREQFAYLLSAKGFEL